MVGTYAYLSVPLSILVSRLNYGVWAFSSPETDAQIIGLGDPLIPYSHKGNIGESDTGAYDISFCTDRFFLEGVRIISLNLQPTNSMAYLTISRPTST